MATRPRQTTPARHRLRPTAESGDFLRRSRPNVQFTTKSRSWSRGSSTSLPPSGRRGTGGGVASALPTRHRGLARPGNIHRVGHRSQRGSQEVGQTGIGPSILWCATVTGDVVSQDARSLGARCDDRRRDTPAYRRTSPGKASAGWADFPWWLAISVSTLIVGRVLLWPIGQGASTLWTCLVLRSADLGNIENGGTCMWYKSQPVKWYELISEMEEFRQRSGWSLAETWGHLHRGDYEAARRSFEEVKTYFYEAHGALPPGR
jgi:hypothetical protein